jgi:hypothetical protein
MDGEKVKLIIRNMELLLDSLKAEIYTDVQAHKVKSNQQTIDYDEVFEDDDD